MSGVAFTGGALLAIVFLLGLVAGAVVCSMAGWLGRRDARPPVAVPAPPVAVAPLVAAPDADEFGFAWHDGYQDTRASVYELRMRGATDGIGRGTGTDAA